MSREDNKQKAARLRRLTAELDPPRFWHLFIENKEVVQTEDKFRAVRRLWPHRHCHGAYLRSPDNIRMNYWQASLFIGTEDYRYGERTGE